MLVDILDVVGLNLAWRSPLVFVEDNFYYLFCSEDLGNCIVIELESDGGLVVWTCEECGKESLNLIKLLDMLLKDVRITYPYVNIRESIFLKSLGYELVNYTNVDADESMLGKPSFCRY